jgi:hypothetical protein
MFKVTDRVAGIPGYFGILIQGIDQMPFPRFE